MKIILNGWSCLALLLLVYCIIEIVKHISYAVMTTKSIKHLKDIPNDQREMLMKYALKKDSEVNKNNESND